ncbi:Adenylosuccinate lyase @ SAICAR lyase [hydrothermal vent metagenome]|uniref:Adenylosuccinate lyase n=1 Tax=hydrothermal vent metagenome TaxID=652676 RepID=A0A3B1DND3_9ZZZZ
MIPRYTRKAMEKIWTLESKYRKWLEVEIAACEAWAEMGDIPQDALNVIREKAGFDTERIDEIEATVKHDVIAFLTSVSEHVGPEARYIHKGLTSSDILDTALALLMRDAADIIISDIETLLYVLKEQAYRHKDTPCMGRSHGIHAEPMTFGLKFALWHEDMKRNLERMKRAREVISAGKLSGAVGTFSNIPPQIEERVLSMLGLKPEPVATQVVQRDRHAEYLVTLAIVAACIEKIAVEIRHLQRTEVLEAEEPFAVGQKGSSAMPHKRNPVGSENLSGLARIVRANSMAALENIPLWHERDISHSSVERVIIPDSTILVDYMLNRLTGILEGLQLYPERMKTNMMRSFGLYNSQRVMLAITEKGLSREEAYALVQRNAMKSWEEERDFQTLLKQDPDVTRHLSAEEIDTLFDLSYYLRNVDYIFKRVFKNA